MVDRDNPDDAASDSDAPRASEAKRDRASILARRKFFIASALAGITAASCNNKEPQVCLKVMSEHEPDAGAPQPCLDILTAEDKDSAAPLVSAVPEPAPSALPPSPPSPEPKVCLKVALPPKDEPSPKVCLRFAAPPKEDPKP
ncbi:MAG TPA: hypothetical protein PKA88_25150 [Polyangiaceae bacterium]|nr:hypothetical protein [Polyangiaceae bacterium]HMR74807.1 hypothetical protein [Polyangiaceae bacterium]